MTRSTWRWFRRCTFSRCSPYRQLIVLIRQWRSNPSDTALHAAATPCDFSVNESASLPGVEPGLRPSQGRVHPPHSKDKTVLRSLNAKTIIEDKRFLIARQKYPTKESNLARLLRKQLSILHTRRTSLQYPNLESNQDLDLRWVQFNPLAVSGHTGPTTGFAPA